MATGEAQKSPVDIPLATTIGIRFEDLPLGELEAFVKAAYALGATPNETVYGVPDDANDPFSTVGLEIHVLLRGSDLQHFDV